VKRFGLFVVAVLVFGLVGAARSNATDLIVNGSFENPNVGGGWGMFSNGQVPGWLTTDSAGDIEIDSPGAIGGTSAYDSNQSLEVNADNPEDVYQVVNNLVVGQQYTLFWAYGDRPDSGSQEMQVYFGPSGSLLPADLVATDSDIDPTNSTLVWSTNTYTVTATAATEYLSFNGVSFDGEGSPSYGDEIDAVSLDGPEAIATPEPATLLLFASGLGLLFFAWRQRRALPIFGKL